MQQQCSECGLLHPPVAPGTCPVRKGQKIDEVEKAEKGTFLVECMLDIKKDFLNHLKSTSEDEIRIVTAKIRNLILNHKR